MTRPRTRVFLHPLAKAPPGARGPPQLERHSERLLIKLLLAKSGLHMHRRDCTRGGSHKDGHFFASVCPGLSEAMGHKRGLCWPALREERLQWDAG